MARLSFSARALEDLERLTSFLEELAPGAAPAALDSIIEALRVLVEHPQMGRRLDRDLRELVISRGVTGYLALYEYDAARDAVEILRLRHQREAGYLD